ncbi:MAG TPA: hypothetical protein VNZ52_14005, partial [Candidatus Thermoplasmatota archaeon]|nr:hypothetical protein [Candidatus Thermoplasmatota archaeon]
RSLMDPKAKPLPDNAQQLTAAGLYFVPRRGGLQVWSWERRKMLAAGREMGTPPDFIPVMGVMDEVSGKFVVVLWELVGAECPLVRGNHCGAYDARPLICRAYPILLQGREVVVSSHCPGAVYKENPPDIEAYLYHAYKSCIEAAATSGRMPEFAVSLLRFLETSGHLRLARGRSLEEAAAAVAAGPLDFAEVLERSGVFSQEALDARLKGIAEGARADLARRYAMA